MSNNNPTTIRDIPRFGIGSHVSAVNVRILGAPLTPVWRPWSSPSHKIYIRSCAGTDQRFWMKGKGVKINETFGVCRHRVFFPTYEVWDPPKEDGWLLIHRYISGSTRFIFFSAQLP